MPVFGADGRSGSKMHSSNVACLPCYIPRIDALPQSARAAPVRAPTAKTAGIVAEAFRESLCASRGAGGPLRGVLEKRTACARFLLSCRLPQENPRSAAMAGPPMAHIGLRNSGRRLQVSCPVLVCCGRSSSAPSSRSCALEIAGLHQSFQRRSGIRRAEATVEAVGYGEGVQAEGSPIARASVIGRSRKGAECLIRPRAAWIEVAFGAHRRPTVDWNPQRPPTWHAVPLRTAPPATELDQETDTAARALPAPMTEAPANPPLIVGLRPLQHPR